MIPRSAPFASLIACAALARAPAGLAEPPAGREWKLVFSDEFDGTEVDATKWEKVGDGKRRDAWWLKANATLDGKGHLVVRSTLKDGKYGCGGLRTRGKFTHAFGYYEIRCDVPREVGTWAAFWLYDDCVGKVGDGGRDGAEIDIFEAPWRSEEKINVAVHWDGYGKDHRSWSRKPEAPGLSKGFHTFGLLWTKDEYVFFYDGKEVARTSEGGVCQVPLYVKVTTEIGDWAGDIKKARLPDEWVVDWVRVYDEAPEKSAGARPVESASGNASTARGGGDSAGDGPPDGPDPRGGVSDARLSSRAGTSGVDAHPSSPLTPSKRGG